MPVACSNQAFDPPMKHAWQKVRLGEVLRHRKEFITIDDLTNYKRPRVQLHVQGIVQRDEVPGALIKTKRSSGNSRIRLGCRFGRDSLNGVGAVLCLDDRS